MYILQVVVNGILLGSIYAVLGLGMSLILGIVKLTNLSHGEYIILGAYSTLLVSAKLGIDPFVSLLITVPLMFIFGYVLQRVLINHAMSRGAEPALLVTFGISIILKDGMLLLFTSDAQHISVSYSNRVISVLGMDISFLNIILMMLSILSIFLLMFFLSYTYTGRAIRAAADDVETAALAGINVGKTFSIAMGIAGATAAIAGFCVSMKWTFYPSSGSHYLLIAFVVVVLGGLGDIKGTLVAGFLFGLIQVIGGANYGMLISYIFLIIMLVSNSKKGNDRRQYTNDLINNLINARNN